MVLPVLATRDQWSHYWGGSDVQRVGKLFEVAAVAFLGLWACYFASFFLGVATMTVIGTVRRMHARRQMWRFFSAIF